jgi:hypothetical protein
MDCKDIVLDTNAICLLPKLKKNMKESDMIFISNYTWEKEWSSKTKGYGLQISRLVEEAINQLKSKNKLIFKTIKTLPKKFEENLRKSSADDGDVEAVRVAYWRARKRRETVVLTGNIDHFPPHKLKKYKIEVYPPESYLEKKDAKGMV